MRSASALKYVSVWPCRVVSSCRWRCSPLLAEGQLRGSAPALLLIAEFDPLLDEGLAYAEHLREQGVVVESRLCRGMTHDFLRMAGLVPEVLDYYAQAAAFLRRCW
ncbi:alpha/beta hydrolase fold domain-containing protein [Pseudomonas sp. SH1-B]